MQNSNSQNYNLLAPLQPIEPGPSWHWNHRVAASNKGAMEIGGLLSGNGRHSTHHDTQLRHHMQQGFSMNHYAIGHNGMVDSAQHYNMGHSSAMDFTHPGQAEHPRLMPSINRSSTGEKTPFEMNTKSPKPKPEPAAKNFNCSTCSKKFARRSDLARHGR